MRRIVVGMSGASGAIYGIRMLEVLSQAEDIETHLILSPSARQTIVDETDWNVSRVKELADVVYNNKGHRRVTVERIVPPRRHDRGALFGQNLSGIVNSYDDNLLTRAADVSLKEKRRVVLWCAKRRCIWGISS